MRSVDRFRFRRTAVLCALRERFGLAPLGWILVALSLPCRTIVAQTLVSSVPIGASYTSAPDPSLDTINDLDGDGFREIVIGTPTYSGVAANGGRMSIVSSGTGALILAVNGTISQGLGTSVATIPDLDGDGFEDVAIGIPENLSSGGNAAPGAVRVVNGVTGATILTLVGPNAGSRLGQSISSAADFDGDGVPELAIGIPQSSGSNVAGAVRVVSLVTGLTLATATSPIILGAENLFGYSIDAHRDLDGDHFADVLVGEPNLSFLPNGALVGRIHVLSGPQLTDVWQADGSGFQQRFGQVVRAIGDVNGDGIADISANGWTISAGVLPSNYLARLYSIISPTPLSTISTALTVQSIADRNGDGVAEIVCHQFNASFVMQAVVHSGTTGAVLSSQLCGTTNAPYGSPTNLQADLDGDGVQEYIWSSYAWNGSASYTAYLNISSWDSALTTNASIGTVTANGVPNPVLRINGSSGGLDRRVDVPVGQPISFDIAQPSSNIYPSHFAFWATFGVPPASAFVTTPFGDFCFMPASASPGVPWLLTVTNNFGPDATSILPSFPAPWSWTLPSGLSMPLLLTFQGLVEVGQSGLVPPATTNAVLVRVY